MSCRRLALVLSSGLAVGLVACGRDTAPVAPSVAGVTQPQPDVPLVLSARPSAPANGALLPFTGQPVSVLVTINQTPTRRGAVTTVEVAKDEAFLTVIDVEPVVLTGPTAVVELTPLAAASTYFWRTRSAVGTEMLVSSPSSFVVGPSVTLDAPVLLPLTRQPTYTRPQLRATAITSRFQPSSIIYRYEVSMSPAFLPVVVSGNGAGNGSSSDPWEWFTLWEVPEPLAVGTEYYWRVQAIDPATNASVYSTPATFTTLPATVDGRPSLHLTSGCPQPYGYENYAFDGDRVVTGTGLRMIVSQGRYPNPLTLDVQIVDGQVSGTLSGQATERFGFYNARVWSWPSGASQPAQANVSGTVGSDGTLTGPIEGRLAFWDRYSNGGGCGGTGPNFWTLYLK